MDQYSRRIIGFGIHAGDVDSVALCRMFNRAISGSKGDTGPAHHTSTRAIQEVLPKTLMWNDELMSGKVSSMNQLAKREGITQRYIAHPLKLAYLAPDIMAAIARGNILSIISLGRLKKGFPLDWQEQRKVLGFSA